MKQHLGAQPVANKVKNLQTDGLQTAAFHRLAYLPCQKIFGASIARLCLAQTRSMMTGGILDGFEEGQPFMISQRAKYALHALIALAHANGPLSASDIAKSEKIPTKFLEQILFQLKRHGILKSKRGKFGGYDLLLPADRITFGHILRITDGPIAPLACLSRAAYRRCLDCRSEESCKVRRVFAIAAEKLRAVLDHATIADVVAEVWSDDELSESTVQAKAGPLQRFS